MDTSVLDLWKLTPIQDMPLYQMGVDTYSFECDEKSIQGISDDNNVAIRTFILLNYTHSKNKFELSKRVSTTFSISEIQANTFINNVNTTHKIFDKNGLPLESYKMIVMDLSDGKFEFSLPTPLK
jgi:hypothetical protein